MKILKLRFKNLNSLVGEWQIDFTAPEYSSEGIYAITGPTGAGKTTILDAICLALYGKTPRLEKINSTTNEIMSRQTAECFSEVTFATSEGIFLCHWGQHRARKKVDGNLVQQRHEISRFSEGEEGQLLEEKTSLVPKVVEDKTGLTFNQFTRSILLAQGNFDTFLKAESDKRAPILEQITGTEIYSEISIAVYERWKVERERLNKIKELSGSIEILGEEAERELFENLKQSRKDEKITEVNLSLAQKKCLWHQECINHRETIALITQEESELIKETEAFALKKESIALAQKASKIEPIYTQLNYLQKEQSDEQKALEDSQTKLKVQSTKLEQATLYVEGTKKEQAFIQKEEERLRPLIAQARDLETLINEKTKHVQAVNIKRNEAQNIQTKLAQEITLTEKDVNDLTSQITTTTDYLKKSVADKVLITELAAIEERLHQVEVSVTEGKALKAKLQNTEKELTVRQEKITQTAKDIATKTSLRDTLKKQITELETQQKNLLNNESLENLNLQRDFLSKETQYIAKIIRLEDERKNLINGKACPLCGATAHPFAENNPKLAPKEAELEAVKQRITQIEKLDKDIQQHTAFLHKEELALQALITLKEHEMSLHKRSERDRNEYAAELENTRTTYKKLEKSIFKMLPHLTLSNLPTDRLHFITDLRNRRKRIVQEEEKYQTLQLRLQKRTSDLDALKKNYSTENLRLTALIAEFTAEDEALRNNKEKRAAFSFGPPHLVEKDLAEKQEKALRKVHESQKTQTKIQEDLAGTIALIKATKKRLAQKNNAICDITTTFTEALRTHDFADQSSFLSARLSPEKLAHLEKCATDLAQKEIALKTKKDEKIRQLNLLQDNPPTENSKEDDEKALGIINQEYKKNQETLGRLKEQVAVNTRAKEKIAGLQQQLLAQTKEFSSWEELYNIIGSADGKKFRNFAQGLSFEQMVNHANRQLIKMSDRYLLTRDSDPKNPLGLQVIDNYQAGEIRSTKNLSGGESFIISLALALGLSHMASQKVRVDSLFLDEGFGTLDSEALETALSALSNLQREDKLIGVISHISSLKERIPTQIEVTRIRGGRSTLQGPGCNKL